MWMRPSSASALSLSVIVAAWAACVFHAAGAALERGECHELLHHRSDFRIVDPAAVLPDRLFHVYESAVPRFTYFDPFVVKSMPSFRPDYTFVNESSLKILQSASPPYRYYSGDILQEEFSQLRSSLPIPMLFGDPQSLRGLTGQVWISQANVTAVMHYDAVNNLFVQLYGKKRMRLYRPAMVDKLGVYGRFHPHSCQSRVEQLGYSLVHNHTQCPSHAGEITVDLSPGDVLVLPPYWFHQVSCSSLTFPMPRTLIAFSECPLVLVLLFFPFK